MKLKGNTFRVFVSSTFTDLVEERNALHKNVFPRLRELCAAYGARFQAVDLRWGVSQEASVDQRTVQICLSEIRRCQQTELYPNFMVLLGERYGWCPPPAEIPADEFEAILLYLKNGQRKLVAEWYRRDDNAVPAVYYLLRRTGRFENYNVWQPIEKELQQVFAEASRHLSLSEQQKSKYFTSATEQEIEEGVFKIADAGAHVVAFFRTIRGLPPNSLPFVDADPMMRQQVSFLKDRLRMRLGSNIHDYTAYWTGSGITTDHIPQLCEDVYERLSRLIWQEMAERKTLDPLELEAAQHEQFGEERTRFFVGRAEMLRTIAEYLDTDDRYPLAIYGVGGAGKSTLIAKAAAQAHEANPSAVIVCRFIGATARASGGRELLTGLYQEIARRYGGDESVPLRYNELVDAFKECLTLAQPHQPLFIFLDALDQLAYTDNARSLNWLPDTLPYHVRLVVSTLPDECLQILENKLPSQNRAELSAMASSEGATLLDHWLENAARTLQPHQREHVLAHFAVCPRPLYLKLAFEEWNYPL